MWLPSGACDCGVLRVRQRSMVICPHTHTLDCKKCKSYGNRKMYMSRCCLQASNSETRMCC